MLKVKNSLKFMQSDKGRQLIKASFIITAGNKIYKSHSGQDRENEYDYGEANTGIIFLAYQDINDVAVVAKDTDALILLTRLRSW